MMHPNNYTRFDEVVTNYIVYIMIDDLMYPRLDSLEHVNPFHVYEGLSV